MLLEDATSKEQVEAALEAGDDELREDIEDILVGVRNRWDRTPRLDDDQEPIDMKDVVKSDPFIDAVIHQSPRIYDLSQIPREEFESFYDVRPRCISRRTKYGPFYIDDTGGDIFSYELQGDSAYTFPGNWFPKNVEFIPKDLAEEFWESLGKEYSWGYTDRLDRYDDNFGHGPGPSLYVEATESDFYEWCRDTLSEYISESVQKDPAKAKEIFFRGLAAEDKGLAEKLKDAALPDEEILDFAVAWFGESEDKEEVLGSIRDYFKALESGTGEPHEVIAEFSKQDIANMGIKKGTLFENAPWKLIKLRPSDLRLEGALMGHCVGDKGMGYIKAVKDGEIEIWSLRSRDNKPRFTLEVDEKFYTADDGSPPMQTLTPAFYRGRAIKQLKGKGNRGAGYADARQSSGIKFPDEVIFWAHALAQLDIDPESVEDFDAFRAEEEPVKLQANDGEVCTGFDLPYRRNVSQNRRSSKRRSSKRRSSRRGSSRR